jgi:tRNA modification GTPase
MRNADAVLLVVDSSEPSSVDQLLEFGAVIPWEKAVVLSNKSDLNSEFALPEILRERVSDVFRLSALTKQGLDQLTDWLSARVKAELSEDSSVISHARHFAGLNLVRESLRETLALLAYPESSSPDFVALELQTGLRAVYGILGLEFDDQVMDRVFNEFCLGK